MASIEFGCTVAPDRIILNALSLTLTHRVPNWQNCQNDFSFFFDDMEIENVENTRNIKHIIMLATLVMICNFIYGNTNIII